jgi:hypothetical protein
MTSSKTKILNFQSKGVPQPMALVLKTVRTKCYYHKGEDWALAEFNSYKHNFTNYRQVITQHIYQDNISFQETRLRLQQIYAQLFQLVPLKYKEKALLAYRISLKKIKRYDERIDFSQEKCEF